MTAVQIVGELMEAIVLLLDSSGEIPRNVLTEWSVRDGISSENAGLDEFRSNFLHTSRGGLHLEDKTNDCNNAVKV